MAKMIHMETYAWFLCLLYTAPFYCKDIVRSDVQSKTHDMSALGQHILTSHNYTEDVATDYAYCYDYFMRLYLDNMDSYHGLCHARDKLKACKEMVLKAHPRIAQRIHLGYQLVYETTVDFWCTYNVTHRIPSLFPSMDVMYAKYLHCPYRSFIMLSHEDYSASIRLSQYRAAFATVILTYTGSYGLGGWQPHHQYEHPRDPVYSALSAWACDGYKFAAFSTDDIIGRYCVIIEDIDRDLTNVTSTIMRHAKGLYNWTTARCREYEDTLAQVMRLSQLDRWLSSQKKRDLSPCHDHNIYIAGATCIIWFHTQLPPYSDIHNFMQPFVWHIEELNSCWEHVTSACAHPSSASQNIHLIIAMYNLACDISNENSAQVWDIIYAWADVFKQTEDAQGLLQAVYQTFTPGLPRGWQFNLPFGENLAETLKQNTQLSVNLTTLFSELASILNTLSIVSSDNYVGLNIFEKFHSMSPNVLDLLLNAFQPMYELFVEVGQFVEYKGSCPEWWYFPCE